MPLKTEKIPPLVDEMCHFYSKLSRAFEVWKVILPVVNFLFKSLWAWCEWQIQRQPPKSGLVLMLKVVGS